MTLQTLGFLFSPSMQEVLLVEKNYRLNGIGGELRGEGETYHEGQVRAFKEVTGLDIPEWLLFAVIRGHGYREHCYMAMSDSVFRADSTATAPVFLCNLRTLSCLTEQNAEFLIPLALRSDRMELPTIIQFKS